MLLLQRSGEVMFSQACVILSMGEGVRYLWSYVFSEVVGYLWSHVPFSGRIARG